VTNIFDNTVTPIDVATNVPGAPIPVGFGPEGIAVTPDDSAQRVNQGSSAVHRCRRSPLHAVRFKN
jgi:YVTN family beta-propeller protein